jgi:hypothetical protein
MIVAGMNTTAIGLMKNYTTADAGNKNWPASEIIRQIQITRQIPAAGHIHWNVGALVKNKGGIADQLRRSYPEPALAPALGGSNVKLSAPGVTATSTGKGAKIQCGTPDANARFLVVQHRGSDGTWRTRLAPPKAFTQQLESAPETVAVRVVDKFGNTGPATVLARRP